MILTSEKQLGNYEHNFESLFDDFFQKRDGIDTNEKIKFLK